MTNKDRKNKVIQRQRNRRQKDIRDRSNKRQGNREKRQNDKKQSLEYYIGRMVLISLIRLRRLLRQRGFVSFRLLFLATAQRVSRCSLPSLRGRGTSMSFITYVIMTSVHYVILASVSLLLCLLHTQPLMSLCHSGFINVKYFY